MDLIPLADPVRIKTIPRDDPSAEAGMAGALAAFLSVLGGDAGGTPPPDGALQPAPALPGVITGTSGAGIAEAEVDAPAMPVARPNDPPPGTAHRAEAASDALAQRTEVPGLPPATGSSPQAGGGTAVSDRATDPQPGRPAREAQSGVKPDAMPAQAAMPRPDAQDARPSGAPDLRIGERVSTGYTVNRAEPGKAVSMPHRDPDAGGSGAPVAASNDAPRVPAAEDRASAAPGLRPVAVPTASAAPESAAATQRPFATAEAAGAESADPQTPPVMPSRPVGAQTTGGPAGLPQPAARAIAEAGGRAPDGTSPVRAGREDAAVPLAAQTRAASPAVAGRGEAQPAESAGLVPTTTDAEPAEMAVDPGDPLAATADAAPLSRGAERAAAGHPATGALPAGLGHRLAEAVSQFPDRPVEITLSPEELGRVRLTLATHDGALTMMVQADRPETLDLLRRNIDSLAQDFRDLGYQDLTFSFGQDRAPRQPHGAETLADAGEIGASPSPAPAEAPGRDPARLAADSGGLDLRL